MFYVPKGSGPGAMLAYAFARVPAAAGRGGSQVRDEDMHPEPGGNCQSR